MSRLKNRSDSEPGGRLKKTSQLPEIWARFRKDKMAMLGGCIVLILILAAIFADVIAPYDYSLQDKTMQLQFPSWEHPLGTDNFGRDILSRIIYGGRISLLVAVMSVGLSVVVGGTIGAVAGFVGGRFETIVMRLCDVFMAVPATLLAVCMSAMLGSGVWQTALAISITGTVQNIRIIRAQVLTIREQEYIEAARSEGARNWQIVFRHVIPNCVAPVIVQATMGIGGSILAISGLSFIGLGVQPPTPEWGSMLNSGRDFIREFYPLCLFPGLAIMITLFAFNIFGDGLRDALDPKLKQ